MALSTSSSVSVTYSLSAFWDPPTTTGGPITPVAYDTSQISIGTSNLGGEVPSQSNEAAATSTGDVYTSSDYSQSYTSPDYSQSYTASAYYVTQTVTVSSAVPTRTATPIPFQQVGRDQNVINVGWDYFESTSFNKLCPNGNCYDECHNTRRLYQAVPDGLNQTSNSYSSQSGMTLFGICSNLQAINRYISITPARDVSQSVKSYFKAPLNLEDYTLQVSTNISSCLATSCDLSRDSENCNDYCSLTALLPGSSGLNLTQAAGCLNRICGNTCGLPYANQDVLGVGVSSRFLPSWFLMLTTSQVIISYITEAIFIMVLAIVLVVSTVLFDFRKRWAVNKARQELTLAPAYSEGLQSLLAAECYFGVTLSIAALCTNLLDIDPLNGYALLSVAIVAFLPPVFTLMLLQSHGIRSWYLCLLTLLSWLMGTVVSFMLLHVLANQGVESSIIDQSLQRLYSIPTCGGSTAMALCRQTIGNNPIEYLAAFFNATEFPNRKTIPVLWIWTTIVLIVLLLVQTKALEKARSKGIVQGICKAIAHWSILLVASILFGLCLGYQARMIIKYSKMDVIDWTGWTFGQVVAVAIWIPPLLELLRDVLRSKYPPNHRSTLACQDREFSI